MTPTAQQAQPRAQGVALSLRGVQRVFAGGVEAVAPLDLAVDAGDFLALLGPSGCGKSTLLRLIAGLDRPDAGQVLIDGRSASGLIGDRGHRVAFVFQDAHLLPWRSVLRNVELPLELRGVGKSERRQRARAAIEQVGLGDAAGRYPAQLSGGMRMRASLARALVTDPLLLLLDEPFAALDEITRHALDQQLRQLWLDRRMTVLFVTHSISEAVFLAQRAVVLSRRPARIVEGRAIDLPMARDSATRTQEAFVREMRYLREALERGGGLA
ncbi:MAG TPA: ABC transporter ATP-binding protein [Phycisphaeraceae bacterium]